MKKTLSFWRRIYRELGWVLAGPKALWMISVKFYFSPTETNLLVSFWYDYQHFRRVQPDKTIDDYLDSRVRYIKRITVDLRRSITTRQLHGDLLQALGDKNIRSMFVSYLNSALPKKDYPQMAAAIRGAWRAEGGLENNERGVEMVSEPVAGAVKVEEVNEPVMDMAKEEEENALDEPAESQGPFLHAKAYVIAAQLDHELRNKASDFKVLSCDLPGLMKFVQERFGVKKLPGTFENFKGYSYQLTLEARNGAKKGQLKKPFRQILDHPEIFGEAVAARAGEILNQHFK